MNPLVRAISISCDDPKGAESSLTREWLVTNGLGGYASGTVCGVPTRRFHGLLVASLPSPLGRTMMLNDVAAEVYLPDGSGHRLGGEEHEETSTPLPGT